jgi:putative tryptophan/tyrosine transport system substrate-binding protein
MTRCRLKLLVTLALVMLVAPLTSGAPWPTKLPRLGVLSFYAPAASPDVPQQSPFWQGMRELGWIEGHNIVVERRWAEGQLERLPLLAQELVQLKVDAILALGGAEIQAAQRATTTIPIVMVALDAVEQGFVASLARPGGNVTGLTAMTADLSQKRLALLKEAVPESIRIAALQCRGLPKPPGGAEMQVAAQALGMHLQFLEARKPDDYEAAFAAALSERATALVVFSCYFNWLNRQRLLALAAQHRLPAIYAERAWVQAGGLMSYGPSGAEMRRRAATYVDKVLRGVKPADLPVEQPTTFELVINVKTAEALGRTIPPTLLFQATEVIR